MRIEFPQRVRRNAFKMNKPEWIRKMLRRRGGPDDKMKRSFNISIYDIDRLNEIQNIANS